MPLSDVNVLGKTDIGTGNVVSLDEHRRYRQCASSAFASPHEESLNSNSRVNDSVLPPIQHCLLVEFLDQMKFKASVEIDDLVWIRGHFSSRVQYQIIASIRKLLCQEFGRNMIQRDELVFIVQHRNVEVLIAGLLRVQFYANQILLPEFNIFGERVDQNGVSVTWGVGRSAEEAIVERVKKRKRRNLRRR